MPAERGKGKTSEAPPITTGATVADKYVVEEVLGTGAMGYVVSARHKLIGQRVAIKLIKASYVDDPDALERFMREARALVAVQSDNVVRVLDYGKMQDESPYLVMELLHGRDLLAELRARGTLDLGEAAEILVQACEGLAAVHARGIIHRDVKPANLFLTRRSNGKLLVKIVDFGISKAPKASDNELSLTRNSLGSPHYMSPEQLRSARKVDARSDVWSLGVTLHRMLTGELPFSGESVGSLMASVMTDQPRSLRALRPDLSSDVEAVLRRCLAKSADDRFATVQDLADALIPFAMPSARVTSDPPPPDAVPSPAPPSSGTPSSPRESTTNAHVAQVRARDPQHDSRKRRNVLAASIAVPMLAAAVALALVPRRPSPERVPAGEPSSSATLITGHPPPATMNTEATAAYEGGLQAMRDGSLVSAVASFEHAVALDPTMGAAELRAALYGDVGPDARRHARTAMALRASMTDGDREILQAVEPLYVPPHPDTVETAKRLEGLTRLHPRDAEVAFIAGLCLMDSKPTDEVISLADHALEIDPKFAGALWLRASTELRAGLSTLALKTVEECMTISSDAASCLRVRARIESASGDCAALEADAKRMVAMEAVGLRAYDHLATALFARGESVDAVREALHLKWLSSSDPSRPSEELEDEARLAIATGDFSAALNDAHDLEGLAETTGRERDRVASALLRVELHTELGQPVMAAQVADAWLRRMSAWPSHDAIEDDPRPILEATAARGGLRTAADRDSTLASWLATWSAEVEPLERPSLWLEGYAAPTESREDAEAALRALPAFSPLPSTVGSLWPAMQLSKVYALAGRPMDALPYLREVTSSCRALTDPGDFVRARLRLGEALESIGDAKGACEAYRGVLRSWGSEKRSVTAGLARTHATTLACPPGEERSR